MFTPSRVSTRLEEIRYGRYVGRQAPESKLSQGPRTTPPRTTSSQHNVELGKWWYNALHMHLHNLQGSPGSC